MRNNNLISEYENGRRQCPRKYSLFFNWIDLPNTILGIQHANWKLGEVDQKIQVNLKTIKQKGYGTLEAKLSWNEPHLPYFKNSSMNITKWLKSRIKLPKVLKKKKYYFWELSDIFKWELCMKTFTANEYMARTLFIQRTERTPCRLPLVLQGILKSPLCFTILIHSICLERQRIQAVDSLEFPVTKVLVCRGFVQKLGVQLYQNLPLVK